MSAPARLPAGPLLEALEERGGLREALGPGWHEDPTRRALARAVYRAAGSGQVTWMTADKLAVRLLGRHPAELWAAEWRRLSQS